MVVRSGSALVAGSLVLCASLAWALPETLITFTGGEGLDSSGNPYTSTGTSTDQINSYLENGVQLVTDPPNASNVSLGDYYGEGNAVVHMHFHGQNERIIFSAESGEAFNLSDFVLTSNTQNGGGNATGNEQAYIVASEDGTNESFRYLLPSQSWGPQDGADVVTLGPEFENIRAFWFESDGNVYCLGMDDIHLASAASPSGAGAEAIPVLPLSLLALLIAAISLLGGGRCRSASADVCASWWRC